VVQPGHVGLSSKVERDGPHYSMPAGARVVEGGAAGATSWALPRREYVQVQDPGSCLGGRGWVGEDSVVERS
jgi:hypothetical protein